MVHTYIYMSEPNYTPMMFLSQIIPYLRKPMPRRPMHPQLQSVSRHDSYRIQSHRDVVIESREDHSDSGLSRKKPTDWVELEESLRSLRIFCRGSMASVGAGTLLSVGELTAEVALVVTGEAGGLVCVGARLRKAVVVCFPASMFLAALRWWSGVVMSSGSWCSGDGSFILCEQSA